MSCPSAAGIGAFLMGCVGFVLLCVVLAICSGCAGSDQPMRWDAGIQTREIDLRTPVESMDFKASIGGTF